MIKATLIGQEHLIPFLREIYPRQREMLEKSVGRMALKLMRKIKEEKLTGQVLKNRTGTLRRSINYRVESNQISIYGIVGSNKSYAAAHEYGINRMVSQSVKAHLRTIKQAWGKPLKDGPREIMVRSFNRAMHMNLPERSFLRASLREMEREIATEMQSTLNKAVKG